MEGLIRTAKKGKAVGRDGTQPEMFQASPGKCAALLTCWWRTIGRLIMFPQHWSHGKFYPFKKRGDMSKPEKYRPLCLLSQIRKILDTAVLTMVNTMFTPTKAKFWFQRGISVEQAIITAEHNARQRGMSHIALLDLEKAYDRVDRRKLPYIATKWLPRHTLNMVRCLIGP